MLNVDLSKGFGRHWAGEAYPTQLFNALSMTFPLGEQSFIDSMRRSRSRALPIQPARRRVSYRRRSSRRQAEIAKPPRAVS
jgi:hypothetical protein